MLCSCSSGLRSFPLVWGKRLIHTRSDQRLFSTWSKKKVTISGENQGKVGKFWGYHSMQAKSGLSVQETKNLRGIYMVPKNATNCVERITRMTAWLYTQPRCAGRMWRVRNALNRGFFSVTKKRKKSDWSVHTRNRPFVIYTSWLDFQVLRC